MKKILIGSDKQMNAELASRIGFKMSSAEFGLVKAYGWQYRISEEHIEYMAKDVFKTHVRRIIQEARSKILASIDADLVEIEKEIYIDNI